jgi:hypothetical protein
VFHHACLLLLLLLGACTTTGTPAPAPVAAIPPGMASITITRASGYYGRLVRVHIDINSQRVAELEVEQSYVAPVRPGPVTIMIMMFGVPGQDTLNFTARAGQRYQFVVGPREGVMAGTVIGAAVLGPVGAVAGGAIAGGSIFPFQIVRTP